MEKETLYVAFSNSKGGVGKTGFTVLAASYLHYVKDKIVAVVDCDYPQYSIKAMRERDMEMVGKEDYYKNLLVNQHEQINKRAYPILTALPENAIDVADRFIQDNKQPVDIIFFDLPGTANNRGVLNSVFNVDYIFTPIIADRLVMQGSLTFVTTINDFLKTGNSVPLKGIYLFWNQVKSQEKNHLYEAYNKIMQQLGLNRLNTKIPDAIRYKREMELDRRPIFRSTLFPVDKKLMDGSYLDLLVEEICEIIKL